MSRSDEDASVAEGLGLIMGCDGVRDVRRGVDLIMKAAGAGDARACFLAASLLALGVGCAQNWPGALDWLAKAAGAGDQEACEDLLALSGWTSDRPVADWRGVRQAIDLEALRRAPVRTSLCEAPRVRAFSGVLPAVACDRLIAKARWRLAPAGVYDEVSGASRADAARTNTAAAFGLEDAGLVVILLREQIAAMAGVPVGALETPQILHYGPGESFRPHCDVLDPARPGHARDIARSGQRIATALVYLNDDYSAGETHFLATGLKHRGGKGDGLTFANVDRSGRPDPDAVHAGEAPHAGEKWVFSQWICDRLPAD